MPKTGREDYDAKLTFADIPDDEPIIVLRARDICGVEAARFYVKKARALQAGGNAHLAPDEELINSIAGHADNMEAYAMANGGFKKADL